MSTFRKRGSYLIRLNVAALTCICLQHCQSFNTLSSVIQESLHKGEREPRSTVLPLLLSANLFLHTGSHEPLWPLLSSPGCPASAVCLVFLHHHSPQTLVCKHFRGQWLTARGRSCQELHCRIPAHNPLPERCAFSLPCETGSQGRHDRRM